MSKPKLRLTAAALSVALLAAACGSDSSNADAPVSTAAEEPEAAEVVDETSEEEMADDEMTEEEMADDEMMEGAIDLVVTIENISDFAITDSGAFAVPVGADAPGPVLPGDAYEFTTHANPGQSLSFATMFVQSNDWFFAPNPEGIALFDGDGNPVSGDITDQVFTFDAGTEADQEVGTGADQAPRQAAHDSGDVDPDDTVRSVDGRTAADYV